MTVQSPAIWLIPFAQLRSTARSVWAARCAASALAGLQRTEAAMETPQIMTVREWASNVGVVSLRPDDLHFDPAIDRLTAERLMNSVAKSTGQASDPVFVQRLLDAAYELSACASCIPSSLRSAWIAQHADLFHTPVFQMEGVIKYLALSWAGGSRYATDVLWDRRDLLLQAAKHIHVTTGLQSDDLLTRLLVGYEHKTSQLLLEDTAPRPQSGAGTLMAEVVVWDAEALVQQTLASVMSSTAAGDIDRVGTGGANEGVLGAEQLGAAEIGAGGDGTEDAGAEGALGVATATANATANANANVRIALVALDRQITRRISAALHGLDGAGHSVEVRDETGWALSTTTAAAQLLAWLNAMGRSAHSDDVLAALKAAPLAFEARQIQGLETLIRANGWVVFPSHLLPPVQNLQTAWLAPRSVMAWLDATRELLQTVQLLKGFVQDEAGQALLAALHITDSETLHRMSTIAGRGHNISQPAFVQWVRSVLEASRFKPSFSAGQPVNVGRRITVTILPLPQLWGRTFDAILLPGCDSVRLPAKPALSGDWRASEREALNLPTKASALTGHLQAWDWVCAQSNVTALRHVRQGDETLQPSVLLERLRLQGRLTTRPAKRAAPSTNGVYTDFHSESAAWPQQAYADLHQQANGGRLIHQQDRVDVFQDGVVVNWQQLAPRKLSASSYADLRACPYRFYATRLLGLSASEELDNAVDKRDFGTWLHGTLHRFHEALLKQPGATSAEWAALLDAAAHTEQLALGLDAAAFLPFSLIWPQTRGVYLAWLVQHTAKGFRYRQGEVWKNFAMELAGQKIELVGQIDRVDSADSVQGGGLLLIDYKTESELKTRKRIHRADEDIQLAFYAALVHNEEPAGERSSRAMEVEPDYAPNGVLDEGFDDPFEDVFEAELHGESHAAPVDIFVQAAYLNLAERLLDVPTQKDGQNAQLKMLPELEARRDALLDGIWADLSNIASGHGLRALGQGEACGYCAARGLCRKDFQ